MEGVGVMRLKAGLEREAGRGESARAVRGESRMRELEVNLVEFESDAVVMELIRRVRWMERPKRCSGTHARNEMKERSASFDLE